MAEYIDVGGFLWPKYGFPAENFQKVQKIKLKTDDIVIDTYPKCGNTWMSYIVWGILNDGAAPPQPGDMKKHIPFPDMLGTEPLDAMTSSPRAMITHVPPPYFPIRPNVKYITVFRNPFDTCVSLFHFSKRKTGENTFNITLPEVFEDFLAGRTAFGDFFEVFKVWNALRNEPHVLFLTYEELKADLVGGIKKVAAFMGPEYAAKLDSNPDILQNVAQHSSFDYMKQKMNFIIPTATGPQKIDFFRKGVVGDWKSQLSEDEKNRLNERMQREMAGTETLALWNKILQL